MENYSLTDRGKVRKNNQDSFINYFHPRFATFVVCDGMGGHKAGEVASAIAVESMQQSIIEKKDRTDYENMLKESVIESNQKVYIESQKCEEFSNMGTTIVAAILSQDNIYLAHVGDSRAYLYRSKELTCLTHDHSLVQKMLDDGAITEEEARNHPDRSTLTRALGTEDSLEVELDRLQARENDLILLCTDGLTGMLRDSEISEILEKGETVREKAENLVERAIEAGGLDNITVSLFEYRRETWNKYC